MYKDLASFGQNSAKRQETDNWNGNVFPSSTTSIIRDIFPHSDGQCMSATMLP